MQKPVWKPLQEVPTAKRVDVFHSVYNSAALKIEDAVYFLARHCVAGYNGGLWDFYHGTPQPRNVPIMYLRPPKSLGDKIALNNPISGVTVQTNADDAGVALTAFALAYAREHAALPPCNHKTCAFLLSKYRALLAWRNGYDTQQEGDMLQDPGANAIMAFLD